MWNRVKKHLAGFSDTSPYNVYRDCEGASEKEKHMVWLNLIRDTVWERTEYEENHVPSLDALRFHWLRCCWVSHYWSQAISQSVAPLNLLQYGWTLTNGMLSFVWDSQANIQKVRDNVKFLTLKRMLMQGNCSTRRCKCSKEHKNCRTEDESTTMTTSHTGNVKMTYQTLS